MSTRKRLSHLIYREYAKKLPRKSCQFCEVVSSQKEDILEQSLHFLIIRNIFPYDVWDTSGVKKHLLLVPKRHVDSIAHFNSAENLEFIRLLATYDKKGFSVYARAANNALKTVVHQHTHLIEIDNKMKRYILFLKKPHVLWTK